MYVHVYIDNLHVFLTKFSSYYKAMNHFKTFDKHIKWTRITEILISHDQVQITKYKKSRDESATWWKKED